MSYSNLQRRAESKSDFHNLVEQWDKLSSDAWDAKRKANSGGMSDSQVQQYTNIANEISEARNTWIDSVTDYDNLPN